MSGSPDLLSNRQEALELMRRGPAGLFTDIDGTLAPICDDPSEATVDENARHALARLAEEMAVVAVTGRGVEEAREMVALSGIAYSGNHGAEWLEDGVRWIESVALPYVPRIREIARRARRETAMEGVLVEDKGPTLSIHYRRTLDPLLARRRILDFTARSASDMRVHDGKMLVEVRPPVDLSKGKALRSYTRRKGLAAVMAIGDDVTDVDAFRAISEMRSAGEVRGASVAVLADDSPDGLAEAADYTVAGPSQVHQFLRWLAGAL